MPLKVACRASDTDKHEWDVTFLLFHKGKLYSASDDGKIKVKFINPPTTGFWKHQYLDLDERFN